MYRMNRAGTTVIVATHDSEMVDRMRRRVIEMTRAASCATRRPGCIWDAAREAVSSSCARRCARLRRNAAPSLAAFATILITTLVLGVFIPVVRAATAKTNEVRNKIELEVFINDDATRAEVTELGNMISDIRHVESIEFVSKAEALRILAQRLGEKSSITEDLPGNPLPRSYRIKLDDPQNSDLVKSSLQRRPARTARRARSAPRSRRSRTARTTPRRSSRLPAPSKFCSLRSPACWCSRPCCSLPTRSGCRSSPAAGRSR